MRKVVEQLARLASRQPSGLIPLLLLQISLARQHNNLLPILYSVGLPIQAPTPLERLAKITPANLLLELEFLDPLASSSSNNNNNLLLDLTLSTRMPSNRKPRLELGSLAGEHLVSHPPLVLLVVRPEDLHQ